MQYEDDFADDVREAVRKMGFAFSRDMSPGPRKTLTKKALEEHSAAAAAAAYATSPSLIESATGGKLKIRPTTRHKSISRGDLSHRRTNTIFTLFSPDSSQADKALSLDSQFLGQLDDQRPRLRLLLNGKDAKKEKQVSKRALLEAVGLLSLQLGSKRTIEEEVSLIIALTKSGSKDSASTSTVRYEEFLSKLPVLCNELRELKALLAQSEKPYESKELHVRGRPSSSVISVRHGIISPARSHKSSTHSTAGFTRLELARFMKVILSHRRYILASLERGGGEPRSPSSSQIMPSTKIPAAEALSILKKLPGLESLSYALLRSVLGELGISAHGSQVSMLLMLRRIEVYLSESEQQQQRERATENFALSPDFKKIAKTAQQVQEDIANCFYREALRVGDFYKKHADEGAPGLRKEVFKRMVDDVARRQARSFSEYEVYTLFNSLSTDGQWVTLSELEKGLRWKLPTGGWN